MNRFDFFFEQLVTQADMDEAFDFAEAADRYLQTDNGYVGIVSGLGVVEHNPTPDLTVDLAAGTAYDQDGQRIRVDVLQNLDLSVDSNSVPTAVSFGGNEKWASIFVAFDRALSDPRVDGNGTPLQYRRAESFQFIIDQGAEAAAGTPAVYTSGNTETFSLANGQTLEVVVDATPAQTVTFNSGDFADIANATAGEVALVIAAQVTGLLAGDVGGAVELTTIMTGPSASLHVVGGTAFAQFGWPASATVGAGGPARPALRPDALLAADVLLRFGTTQIFDAPDPGGGVGVIDAWTRRQTVFNFTGAQFTIKEGTIVEFADAIAQELNNHINQVGASHDATSIGYDPTELPVPAGWTNMLVAGELQSAVDGIIADLSATTAPMGSSLVGHNVLATWEGGTAVTQATNTVFAAIEGIITDLADASGTDGASRVGFDGTLSAGADLTASHTNVAEALSALDALKGSLANDNDWAGTNNFNDPSIAATFATLARFDGNVRFNGASFVKEDPAHGLSSWTLTLNENSLQDTGSATDTVDMTIYFNTGSRAGIIRGTAMVYTDNLDDSFVAVSFVLPFTKGTTSAPQLDNNSRFFVDFDGGVANLQGGAPTSASLNIVATTDTISLRLTHNAGPTTRNLVALWDVLEGPLNS